MVLLNLTLNLILVQVMDEAGVALATSISAAVQAVWLAVALRRPVPHIRWMSLGGRILRTIVATAIMGVVVWLVLHLDVLHTVGGRYSPLVRLLVSVSAGVTAYAVAARVINRDALRELTSGARR